MAWIAVTTRPRFWMAGALLGIALLGGHEPRRERTPAIALGQPLDLAAAPNLYPPRIDPAIVQAPPETGDHMNAGVGPLASWISHLLLKLTGDAC